MNEINWENRYEKKQARIITGRENANYKNVLDLPGVGCIGIKEGLSKNKYTQHTKFVFFERNTNLAKKIKKQLLRLGLDFDLINQDVLDYRPSIYFDFINLDLMCYFNEKVIKFLNNIIIKDGFDITINLVLNHRNQESTLLKHRVEKAFCEEYNSVLTKVRQEIGEYCKDYILFNIATLLCVLNKWEFDIQYHSYNDSSRMMTISLFNARRRQNPLPHISKILNLTKNCTKEKDVEEKTSSCEPLLALRAHCSNRKKIINRFIRQLTRQGISGKNYVRSLAALKAHLTRKIKLEIMKSLNENPEKFVPKAFAYGLASYVETIANNKTKLIIIKFKEKLKTINT